MGRKTITISIKASSEKENLIADYRRGKVDTWVAIEMALLVDAMIAADKPKSEIKKAIVAALYYYKGKVKELRDQLDEIDGGAIPVTRLAEKARKKKMPMLTQEEFEEEMEELEDGIKEFNISME